MASMIARLARTFAEGFGVVRRPERLIAVRVGRAAQSHAPFRLHHQADINNLLRLLITLRAGHTGSGLRAPGSGV